MAQESPLPIDVKLSRLFGLIHETPGFELGVTIRMRFLPY
jgi:hypothetical protein